MYRRRISPAYCQPLPLMRERPRPYSPGKKAVLCLYCLNRPELCARYWPSRSTGVLPKAKREIILRSFPAEGVMVWTHCAVFPPGFATASVRGGSWYEIKTIYGSGNVEKNTNRVVAEWGHLQGSFFIVTRSFPWLLFGPFQGLVTRPLDANRAGSNE